MPRFLVLLRLAVRNLRRQVRRSLLTASAMVLGVAVLVFARTLGDGAHSDWIEQGVRLGEGHVAIQHPGFQASRHLDDRLSPDALADARAALQAPGIAPDVDEVAPRLEMQGLANSPTAAVPVFITGVDPAIERRFSHLSDRVTEGRYLESDDRLDAFIGDRLADRLDIGIGSRLVLTAQDASGEIAGQLVHVVGIFHSGIPEVDQGMVHVPLETVQQWLGVPGSVTTLAVLLQSNWMVDHVRDALRRALADNSDQIAVLGWREAMPELDAAIRLDDFGAYLFDIILYAIVGLAIINTVLMSVLYRRREFGVLQALGLTGRETATVVFGEGVLLTFVSGVAGMLLGFGVTWLLFRNGLDYSALMQGDFTISGVVLDPVIVPIFRATQVWRGVAWILVIGVIASLYPAIRAWHIDVAEAMKFEA